MLGLQTRRQAFRQQLRKESLHVRREQVREVLLKVRQVNENQCYICSNMWLIREPKPYPYQLLINIFRESLICQAHIERFFSRMLKVIFDCPPLLLSIFIPNQSEKCAVFIRRTILLHEVIDNQLLQSNKELQNQLLALFSQRQGYVRRLFQEAWGMSLWFDQGGVLFESRELKSSLRWITVNTVLLLLKRCPLLISSLLEDYPLVYLWRQSSQQRRIEILAIIGGSYTDAVGNEAYRTVLRHMEDTLVAVLEDPLKIEKQLMMLLEYVLCLGNFLQTQTLEAILIFCHRIIGTLSEAVIRNVVQLVRQRSKQIRQQGVLESAQELIYVLSKMDIQIN